MLIIIPGQPIAKGRPRASIQDGRIHMRTPDKTANWTTRAAMEIRRVIGCPMYTGPVRVDVVAVFKRPQRMLAKKWPNRRELHAVKPDRDNIDKIICDALTKAGAIKDDCQVCDGRVQKFYADRIESAHVEIIITTMEEK
jgi:Holliday junction resolvase RusA-like endonuclease